MAHYTPQRSEQEQRIVPRRQQPLKCPMKRCPMFHAQDDRTRTERITSLADVPALSHMRTFDRGHADITEAFMDYLCPGPRVGPVDYEALDTMFAHFMDTYPSLGMTVFRFLHWERRRALDGQAHPLAASNRMQAQERGLSDHTIATELAHGRTILAALAVTYRVFL